MKKQQGHIIVSQTLTKGRDRPCKDLHIACVRRGAVEDLGRKHNLAHLLTEEGVFLCIKQLPQISR